MADKRAEFRDAMALLSLGTFATGGLLLLQSGADPSALGDTVKGVIDQFLGNELALEEGATTQDAFSAIKERVIELFVSGGWALSGGIAFLWSRIRILGLTILAAASGRGSITQVPVDWADTVGPIGHAGMLLLMISTVAATAGLLTIFSRGKRAPEPVQLLQTVGNRRV
ncbi:MAG: hypothetical protein AAGI89_12430 [Pseudomonadota bacterium]